MYIKKKTLWENKQKVVISLSAVSTVWLYKEFQDFETISFLNANAVSSQFPVIVTSGKIWILIF